MNRKKSFGHLLITYTVILLLPVMVMGVLLIFSYMKKLEKDFEALNTKTVEAATARTDLLMEDVLAVDYQLSLDVNVHDFLTRKLTDKGKRLLLLQDVRDTAAETLISRGGVVRVALYSQTYDIFVGNNAAFDWRGLMERYFARSGYTLQELTTILAEMGVTPVWLDSGDYLIYCSNILTSGYAEKGKLLAVVSKQAILDAWAEVFGSLEAECAIVYRGQEVLMKTDGFQEEIYRGDSGSRSGYLIKEYPSEKMGSLAYVYCVDREHFGGDIAQMLRSLGLVVLTLLLASTCLAWRKAKHIRTMYTEVLEENVTLEDQLNTQVEELNRQVLWNALRGIDHLTPEKQGVYLNNSRIRVLIFRPVGEEAGEQDLLAAAENCLAAENIRCLMLYQKDPGYILVLGYESEEKLGQSLDRLQAALEGCCGMGVHLGMSTPVRNMAKLSNAYERAGTALHYCRFLREDGGLVDYGEVSDLEKAKLYYPPEKEQQLLRSIRMGMQEEAEECLERIYLVNFRERRLSGGEARKLLVKMLNTAYALMEALCEEEPEKQEEFDRLSQNVLLTRSPVSAFGMLRDSMLSLCQGSAERKEGELRKRIIAYIGKNFRDQELSLEKMAEDFEISYYHLSRLFNDCMQMNFASYLAGLRLEYSTELLRTTNYSVEQVAQQAGFLQSGSFIRAFKKYYGVTPGKYREERKKKQ